MQRIESNGPHSYADYDIDFKRKMNQEWRKINPYYRARPDYDTTEWLLAEKMPIFMMVGFAAALVWLITALLKLMIPTKWEVVTWINGALCFIGKWAFWICLIVIAIIYIGNFIMRIRNRKKNRRNDN